MERPTHATEPNKKTNGDAASEPTPEVGSDAGFAQEKRTRFVFVDRLKKLRDDAVEKVRENPLAALAVAVGIGIMIGAAPRQALSRAAMYLGGQFLVGDLPHQSPNGTAFRDAS